jgi:hypothetical protein
MLKTVSSIANAIGALNYKGTWDANANSPALTSSVGTKGDYYVVGTAGSTNLNGISNWGVGDLATFNGSVWQRVEGGADLNGVNLSVSGTSTLSNLTASTALALNASKEIVSVTNTGTGDNVLATAPTLVDNVTASTGNVVIGTAGKGITTGSAIGLGFGVNGSLTNMSIDSSGNTFVAGRTSTATTATGSYFFDTTGILAQGRVNGGDVQRFFCTDNGNQVGSITVSTAATAFNITSDQRLKNDLGIVTTTNVIRDTKIHDYEWKNIGVQGRGVFAQEAILVKPDAVSKGELDGLDENGRPTNPWSVDYSKYIPDLIVYCQELERRIAALEASK